MFTMKDSRSQEPCVLQPDRSLIGIFMPTMGPDNSTFLLGYSRYSENLFWSSGSSTSLSKQLSSHGFTRSLRRIAAEALLPAHPLLPCCGSLGCLSCPALRFFRCYF